MKFLINNIMKTAVEWLQEKWLKYDLNVGKSGFNLLLKQAEEMEKQQIIEAHGNQLKKSRVVSNCEYWLGGADYYNETFKL